MSDTSKNPEHYYEYQPDFHVWSVHFENLPQLSVDRVLKLFSKYGRVQNVSQTGSSQGYVFISYRDKEHAKKAVLQVYQDTKIKLRAFNPRIRSAKDKQLNLSSLPTKGKKVQDPKNLPKIEKNYKKYYQTKSVFFANEQQLSKKEVKDFFEEFGEVDIVQQTGPPTGWCFVRFLSEASARKCAKNLMDHEFIHLQEFEPISVLQMKKKRKEEKNLSDDETIVSCDVESRSTSRASSSTSLRNELIESLRKFASKNASSLQKVTVLSNNERTNKFFYVPMNSRVSWKCMRSVIVDYVETGSIFVGNIDESCGTEGIRKLFEKCQPIYVTFIRIIPENLIRYCYVYFENYLHANAAEAIFDNLEVFGKKLVILRPEV